MTGFGQLLVGNLFAFRTASTRVLRRVDVPVGADNDVWLRRLVGEARVVVAAWGNFGRWLGRDRAVVELLGSMQCLGVTRFGQPRHPLYLRASSGLRDFDARSVSGSWRGGG